MAALLPLVEAESDEILGNYSATLMADEPKIGAAVKNCIAMILARSSTDPAATMLFETQTAFAPGTALACGRCLLQAFEMHSFLSPMEYAVAQPQGAEQSGDERLVQLIKYKCLYVLRTRAKEHGGKVSTLFGRSFFLWSGAWPQIKAGLVAPAMVPSDMFAYFLDVFERALALERDDLVGVDVAHDAQLVWAGDFYEVLRRRQEQRKADAAERLNCDNDNDGESDRDSNTT